MPPKPKDTFSVRLEGLSEAEDIPGGIERAQRHFLERAGKRFVTSLQVATPRRRGRLARSWRYDLDGGSPPDRLRLVNDQPYAKAIDRGAFIRPKSGRFLRFTVGGREVFVRSVRLPAANIGKKGLRGRGRIMQEEFVKAMDRLGG